MINIVLSSKKWNNNLVHTLEKKSLDQWIHISNKASLNFENLASINPKRIYIPHWSHIIPEEIFNNYECIVFHMTDLPFGRGGSPLQNLIERGYQKTMISALRVNYGIDTGDIYLKRPLSLLGTAEEIFIRANKVIEEMILEISEKEIESKPQIGEPFLFKRRKPEQSSIAQINELEQLFDHIRMLDAEGYPHAFLETESFKFEFTRASLKANETLIADVRIIKK